MDIVWISAASLLILLGFIGCLLPVLPGPVFAYLALLVMLVSSYAPSTITCVVFGIACAIVLILDSVVPAVGAKKFKCSKWGVLGCIIGSVIGLFLGPWGVLFGPFVGAVAGEITAGRKFSSAIKGGFGAFIGFVFGVVLKFAYCAACAGWIIYEIIK